MRILYAIKSIFMLCMRARVNMYVSLYAYASGLVFFFFAFVCDVAINPCPPEVKQREESSAELWKCGLICGQGPCITLSTS